MGDVNQLAFVRQNFHLVKGPVLEVGSKDYGNTPDFRALLPGCEYLGVDMEPGKGVDMVLDLTSDFDTIAARLPGARFNTVICFSVLEHCTDPFQVCRNIAGLLNPNGVLLVSVPFSWKVHGYPSDYWRFTAQAVRLLFPDFDFDRHPGNLSTSVVGETDAINDAMMRVELSASKGRRRGTCGPVTAFAMRLVKALKLMPQVFRYHYLLPPVMINMIGVKKGSPSKERVCQE